MSISPSARRTNDSGSSGSIITAVADWVPGFTLKMTPRSGNTSPMETPCSSRIDTVRKSAIANCLARSPTATGSASLMRIAATTSPSSVTSTRSKGSIFQKNPRVPSSRVNGSPAPQPARSSSPVVLPGWTPRKLAGSIESVGISSGVAATGAVTVVLIGRSATGISAGRTSGDVAAGSPSGAALAVADLGLSFLGFSFLGLSDLVVTAPVSGAIGFTVGFGRPLTLSVSQRLRTLVSGPRPVLAADSSAAGVVAAVAAGAPVGTRSVHSAVSRPAGSAVVAASARSTAGAGFTAARNAGAARSAAGVMPCSATGWLGTTDMWVLGIA